MTKVENRGGVRTRAGRKPIPKEQRRIAVTVYVRAANKAAIRALADKLNAKDGK